MSVPVAKAYVTKDNRIISMLDGLEEDIKCKLELRESGVYKMSGRCTKKDRLNFLNCAMELSKQLNHGYSNEEIQRWIATAIESEK